MTTHLGSSSPSAFKMGSSDVDALYLGSNLLYQRTPGVSWTEHNVFGNVSPVTVNPHADLGVGGWTGSNFLLPYDQSGEWELAGGRLYIPSNIGDEISLPFQVSFGYYLRNDHLTDDVTNTIPIIEGWESTASSPTTVSSMGWFEYRLPTPIPISEVGSVAVGWKISDGRFYVHSPGTAFDAIVGIGTGSYFMATDGSAVGLDYDSGSVHRGEFGSLSDSGWAFRGAWYGADIILRKKNS